MIQKKDRGSNKKFKILLSVILVLIAAIIAFCVISKTANNRYWSNSHLDDLSVNMSRYEEYLSSNNENQSDIKSTVHVCNQSAVPIRAECEPFFEQCNDIIISFFRDVYEIDITEKLSKLQILSAEYPEEISATVGGSYSSERKAMCINSLLLDDFAAEFSNGQTPSVFNSNEFSVKLLMHVYIHETIHYFGFSDSKSQFSSFIEAATEALTEKIISHSGIKYENLTGYSDIKDLGAQIIDADSDMVRFVLSDDTYSIDSRFKEFIGEEHAEEFNNLIFILQRGGATQYSEVPYFAQYIAFEYAKAANPDFKQAAKQSITNFFELKWFFNVYE